MFSVEVIEGSEIDDFDEMKMKLPCDGDQRREMNKEVVIAFAIWQSQQERGTECL